MHYRFTPIIIIEKIEAFIYWGPFIWRDASNKESNKGKSDSHYLLVLPLSHCGLIGEFELRDVSKDGPHFLYRYVRDSQASEIAVSNTNREFRKSKDSAISNTHQIDYHGVAYWFIKSKESYSIFMCCLVFAAFVESSFVTSNMICWIFWLFVQLKGSTVVK